MPAASAMSRTVVLLKPFSAKSPAAIASSSSRRVAVSGCVAQACWLLTETTSPVRYDA